MEITLYYNESENNKVDKTLTEVTTLTGALRDNTSVTDPVILFEYAGTLPLCNYVYIPDFKRYYFVGEIDAVRTGLWSVSCHCDVLMSFRDEIRKNKAIIRRQENLYNMYLDDGIFKSYQNPDFKVKYFPSGFTNASEFVLAVAGG